MPVASPSISICVWPHVLKVASKTSRPKRYAEIEPDPPVKLPTPLRRPVAFMITVSPACGDLGETEKEVRFMEPPHDRMVGGGFWAEARARKQASNTIIWIRRVRGRGTKTQGTRQAGSGTPDRRRGLPTERWEDPGRG